MLKNLLNRLWCNRVTSNTENDTLEIKIGIDSENVSGKHKRSSKGMNKVKSTKYTLLSFLPLNLFEQFKRIANFYFLCLAIIAVVMNQVSDSPVSPITSILPLVFVISVTAIKQGYENYLKYKADNMVNKSFVTVIRNGKEEDIQCQDIQPGDLVKVSQDCDVPCDLVLLKSSEDSERCYITTANLDGETNLKTLVVPKGLPEVEIEDLYKLGYIKCEHSKTDLYSFNGRIELSAKFSHTLIQEEAVKNEFESTKNAIPLMAENILLRGSRVRNTEWAIACAVYTGQNTKLALNSKLTRNKMTSSEKFINKYLLFFLVIFIGLVIFSAALKFHYDEVSYTQHFYLFIKPVKFMDHIANFFAFLILYNYIIPISLYVTIEMHKFIGAFFMEWDQNLYDEQTDQPCIVNTSDLNEELGQVNILFSDKTGTLTKNEMIFQQCSINGRRFYEKDDGLQEYGKKVSLLLTDYPKYVQTFFEALAICHTVQKGRNNENDPALKEILKDTSEVPKFFSSSLEQSLIPEIEEVDEEENEAETKYDQTDSNTSSKRIHKKSISLSIHPVPFNRAISTDCSPSKPKGKSDKTHRRSHSNIEFSKNKQGALPKVPRFQRNISTRSSTREYYAAPTYTTASLLERNESMRRKKTKSFIEKLDYQASSPDEKALVEASAKQGIIFLNDNNDILRIKVRTKKFSRTKESIDNEIFHFKRLAVLEFTSDRKRMSVIVMDRNGQIWMYTKGAESHVLPLCANTDFLTHKTQFHINEFAKEGLRTLAIARKKLTKAEFINFHRELTRANNSLTNRVEEVDICQRKIESGLELLGATAVEDALQDNVRDTLESLRLAGIKIWVLTGDKVETALNIALSCGHIPPNAYKYFITECRNQMQVKEHLELFDNEIVRNPVGHYALLIDGASLAIALKYESEKFRDTTIKCHAVLCCRLSPLQKSEVVHLMKTAKERLVTAAIGDGANDVSMIQEAHVGLGIVGKEGRQAARCSDYAFANFSMLKRILFLHGHYSSQRLAILVLYFFYKNLVLVAVQFFFQMDSLFSNQSIYDSFYLTLYNTLYTAFPVLLLSLTEKVYTEEKLMKNPELYKKISRNQLLAWKYFFLWIIFSLFHSIITYIFSSIAFSSYLSMINSGKSVGIHSFGTALIQNAVIVVNLKLLLETTYKTYALIITIILSIASFVVGTYVYSLIDMQFIFGIEFGGGNLYQIYSTLLSSLNFWMLSILIIISALIPDMLLRALYDFNIRFHSIFPKYTEIKLRKKSKMIESTDL